tara:strand:- start:398 stop:829 length:432 start_codon:yes stop_codon:yes gene_type:complete
MRIYTIGFTKSSAKDFFQRLRLSGTKKIIDTRLNNSSQLSGFAKGLDLKYFSKEICNIDYKHNLDFAPTKEILNSYRKKEIDWSSYEDKFNQLIASREIELTNKTDIADSCLLCSEDKPHNCHRRLVAEYLNKRWGNIEIIHL